MSLLQIYDSSKTESQKTGYFNFNHSILNVSGDYIPSWYLSESDVTTTVYIQELSKKSLNNNIISIINETELTSYTTGYGNSLIYADKQEKNISGIQRLKIDVNGTIYYSDIFKKVEDEFEIVFSELIGNNIIHITFSEAAYNSSNGAIDISDFTFTYTDNSDTLITAEILHLTDAGNSELSGGEVSIYAHLYLEGQSDGKGTVKLDVIANSIYNLSGTAMNSSETTENLLLNAETIDFIPNLKGVSLYMDGNDATTVDETGDFIWTDKTNNGFEFKQSTGANKPTNDIATNQAIDFDTRGDYLLTDKPVYLDDVNGYSLFFALYYPGGDQIILESESFAGSSSNYFTYLMIRNTSILVSVGSGGTFTYSLPVGYHVLEFRRTSTQMELYVDGVSQGTPVVSIPLSIIWFNRIGSSNAVQGMNDKIRNVTVYNGTDATVRSAIYTKLAAKFIGQTELSNIHRINYQIPLPMFGLFGDSNGIGRDETGDLTSPYVYILGVNSNTYIGSVLQPLYFKIQEDYDPDTKYGNETTADDFGVEASMLYWIRQNNKYGSVIKYAVGGSYLGAKGVGTDWIKSQQASYRYLLRYTNFCLQSFNDLMFNPDFKGIIMMIGYNDTDDSTLTAAFSANFAQFKIDVRADLDITNLWFRTHNIQNGTGKTTINNAQIALAAADNYHSHSIYTDSMVLMDTVHYDADSIVQIGKDDFDNWLNQI